MRYADSVIYIWNPFFFYPNDHEPIHIHIEYQGKSAKIQVEPDVIVVENNGLKAQTIKKAVDTVVFYKEDIIAAWHEVFNYK